jgi:hypothetical protein
VLYKCHTPPVWGVTQVSHSASVRRYTSVTQRQCEALHKCHQPGGISACTCTRLEGKYPPSGWHPIGHMSRIFPVADIPLATCQEYSQWLTSHWPHVKNIPSGWHPIGHMSRIFPVADIPLATCQEYSQWLTSHWPHVKNILCDEPHGWPSDNTARAKK